MIGVISDTHGLLRPEAIAALRGVEHILHAGDVGDPQILDTLREVFSQTGANSRVLETDGADMQNRDHEVYFSAAHAAKDSGIALSLANDVELNLPLAQATYDQYERMKELGLGELDKSGISELTFKSRHGRTLARVTSVGGK